MRPLVSFVKEISVLFLFQLLVVFYILACYVGVFYIREIVLVNFTDVNHCVPVVEFRNLFLISLHFDSDIQVVVPCYFFNSS